ncbi:hypothetical protein FOZ62_024583, partial [Perkinsus olseni]
MRYGPQSPGKSEPQHIDDVLQPTRHSAPQGCPEVDDASPAVSVVRQRFKRLRIDGEDDEPELSESSGLISGDETQLEGVPEHKRRCTDVSSDKSSIGSSCGDRSDQGPSSPRQSDTPMVASRNDQLHHQRKMQLKQLLKNFAREVDERRGTEDKLTRHVQQQVEELVNIVRESEAKTEQ